MAQAASRLAMATTLLLAACGGSGPEPAATEVAAGQQAQATVGAAGGTVTLATREGARITLTAPAGAVPDGTVLALETAAPAAGRRLHLRLSPAGLLPAQPLVLAVSLPASMALPSGATLAYDRAPLPVTRLADGSLELRLSALAAARTAGTQVGRARALAARALADAPANPCGSAPALEGTAEGGLADTGVIEADLYGSCMLGAVNALALSGEFAEAVRLASSVGAYLQSIGAANTDNLSTRFLDEARTLACTAYGLALDTAAGTSVTSFATLPRVVRPVLFWEAAVQKLGAACAGIAPTRYADVVEQLTTDALRYFATRRGAVVETGSVEYTEAVSAVRAAPQTVAQLRSLQAPAPVQALAQAQVQQRAQPAVVDAVLQAPWQRCRDSGQYDKLMELMDAGGSPPAVQAAAQHCGTLLQVQARAADGSALGTPAPALGGVGAGQQRSAASVDVAADGTLVLEGPIRALQCPAGSVGGTESLELKLGGVVLHTLTAAPYLATSLVIDVASALRTAGIAADTFEGAALTLTRTGSPCGGYWGANPEPLLTLDLQGRRSVVLVMLGSQAGINDSQTNYRRLLTQVYGSGRVTVVDGADAGPALFQRGRDVIVVGSGYPGENPMAWANARRTAIEPWVRAGGRLLLQAFSPYIHEPETSSFLGIGIYTPPPADGHNHCYTVTWAGGQFSTAGVIFRGEPMPDLPFVVLAGSRVSGFDVNLMHDDDLADGWTDDPAIFPINFDNVGQGEAVAALRHVGAGRVLVSTLAPPWVGYGTAMDPALGFILENLRGR